MKQILLFQVVLLAVLTLWVVSVHSEQPLCGNKRCAADEVCMSKFGKYRPEGCQKLGKEDAKCDHLAPLDGKFIHNPPCEPGLLCRVRNVHSAGPRNKRCTDPLKPTTTAKPKWNPKNRQ